MGPYSNMTVVLIKRTQCGETNTHPGRTPYGDEGRDWQQKPRNNKDSRKPPEARGKAWNIFSLMIPKGTNSTNALILDF